MRHQGDCYEYARNYYKVPAFIGTRVRIEGREGVLVNHRPGDQYVYILINGEKKSRGPYHPTDGIEYLGIGNQTSNAEPADSTRRSEAQE